LAGSIAFASVYKQAGLFTESSSRFSGVSSNSGGTWFSTQFFYSQKFHDAMFGTPEEVSTFFTNWMNTYRHLEKQGGNEGICWFIKEEMLNEVVMGMSADDICAILQNHYADTDIWPKFIERMLRAASTGYGDPNFVETVMRPGNRVHGLQETTLSVVNAISPVSRTRRWGFNDHCTYLGPSDADKEVYNVVLPASYVVTHERSGWESKYVTDSKAYVQRCTKGLVISDWNDYFTPATDSATTIQIPLTITGGTYHRESLRTPFGGNASVLQVAAASSAAGAFVSPVASVPFAQFIHNKNIKLHHSLIRISSELFSQLDGAAVCTNYPQKCAEEDGLLLDGFFVDNPALVASIASYQKQIDYDVENNSIKVVLNMHNDAKFPSVNYDQFLAYFRTYFNKKVLPGGYLSYVLNRATEQPSMQIFAESLEPQELEKRLMPIEGTDLTYAIFEVTTVDNPVAEVRAGQSVELLLFFLNIPVRTLIVGESPIKKYTPILANMISTVASNQGVIDIVQSFFDDT